MGITVNDLFENLYGVIFTPKNFFERENCQYSVRAAAAVLITISALLKISNAVFSGTFGELSFGFGLVGHLLYIITVWFLTGLFFEYTAMIFDKGGKLKQVLFYTAFASVPYIFFLPAELIKNTGNVGYFIGTIIEILLYLRIIFLYAYSLRAAYNISFSRSFMFIFIPFVSLFFFIYWSICFFSKLWYIFSV